MIEKNNKRIHRKRRIRAKISGTAQLPRLSLFRSLRFIYAQLIDDEKSLTLATADSRELKKKGFTVEISKEVGKLLGQKAKAKGIETVVFDRSGYRYHGKVKALAEGAREAGLKF